MIGVVDYSVGNIQAFLTVFKRLGVPAIRVRTVEDLRGVDRLILPGVGSYDNAMRMLLRSGLREPLEERVIRDGIPVMGVCVGMQMLAMGSDEGSLPGLGWIPGRVKAFSGNPLSALLPMPHMGWNDLDVVRPSAFFSDFAPKPRFYFLHSYYFDCEREADVTATADYGVRFPCVVSSGHIHGIQCHPEKSHHFGASFLKNFSEY